MRRLRLTAVLLVAVVAWACSDKAEVPGNEDNAGSDTGSTSTLVESPTSWPSVVAANSDGSIPDCPPPSDSYISEPPFPSSTLLGFVFEWTDVPFDELQRVMGESGIDERDEHFMRLGSLLPEGIADLRLDSTTIALPRGRDPGFDEWLFFPGMEQLLANRVDTRALVGLKPSGQPHKGLVTMVVLENADGSFTLLGQCNYGRVAARVGEYARDTSATSAYAVLKDIATDGEALAAFNRWSTGGATREPVAWADRSPRERQLDPEAAPPDVLESLESVLIVIESVPKEWRDFDAGMCSWMSQGWSLCTVFDAYPDGEPLDVSAYFDPDEVLEIWLVDGDTNFFGPLAKLATFDEGDLDDAGALHLRVVGEWPTEDALIAGAKAGRTVFEAVP